MPRRRARDPTRPIKITIPSSILDAIHAELSETSSRSLWISDACREKLEGAKTLDESTSMELAIVLVNRGAITENMFEMMKDYIRIMEKS